MDRCSAGGGIDYGGCESAHTDAAAATAKKEKIEKESLGMEEPRSPESEARLRQGMKISSDMTD